MPLVSEIYATRFLKATDLPEGRRIFAFITAVASESVGQGEAATPKLILDLRAADGRKWPKQAIANKTNAALIGAVYGDNTDGWINRGIEIWREAVMFQGRALPGVRMAAAMAPPSAPPAYPGGQGLPAGNSGAIAMPPPAPAPDMTRAYAPIPGAAPPQPRTVDEALAAQRPPLAQPRTVVYPDGQTPSYADIPGGPDPDGDLDDAIPF